MDVPCHHQTAMIHLLTPLPQKTQRNPFGGRSGSLGKPAFAYTIQHTHVHHASKQQHQQHQQQQAPQHQQPQAEQSQAAAAAAAAAAAETAAPPVVLMTRLNQVGWFVGCMVVVGGVSGRVCVRSGAKRPILPSTLSQRRWLIDQYITQPNTNPSTG